MLAVIGFVGWDSVLCNGRLQLVVASSIEGFDWRNVGIDLAWDVVDVDDKVVLCWEDLGSGLGSFLVGFAECFVQ